MRTVVVGKLGKVICEQKENTTVITLIKDGIKQVSTDPSNLGPWLESIKATGTEDDTIRQGNFG